jgi:hypothetical protein
MRKHYSCSDLSAKSVVLAPFQGKSEINYNGSVENEFGKGNMNELILKYLRNQISKRLQERSCFGNVAVCEFLSPPTTKDTLMKVDNTGIPIYSIPIQNNSIDFNGCKADIILFINSVKLSSISTVHTVYAVPVYISKDLDLKFNFLFWDNRTNDIVSYGKASYSTSSPVPAITITNWETVVDGAIDDVMCDKAYEKKMPEYQR